MQSLSRRPYQFISLSRLTGGYSVVRNQVKMEIDSRCEMLCVNLYSRVVLHRHRGLRLSNSSVGSFSVGRCCMATVAPKELIAWDWRNQCDSHAFPLLTAGFERQYCKCWTTALLRPLDLMTVPLQPERVSTNSYIRGCNLAGSTVKTLSLRCQIRLIADRAATES